MKHNLQSDPISRSCNPVTQNIQKQPVALHVHQTQLNAPLVPISWWWGGLWARVRHFRRGTGEPGGAAMDCSASCTAGVGFEKIHRRPEHLNSNSGLLSPLACTTALVGKAACYSIWRNKTELFLHQINCIL